MAQYNSTHALRTLSQHLSGESHVFTDEDLYSNTLAEKFDQHDELSSFRSRFHIPPSDPENLSSTASVYMCGNSLGLQPRATEKLLTDYLTAWRTLGVAGHFDDKHCSRPWAAIDENVTPLAAKLVGAHEDEVAVCNTLTANLHLLLVSFYLPEGKRNKILLEDHAFCSDNHVVWSQVKFHGLDPEECLIRLRPRAGETYLRTEDIIEAIHREGDSIATVLMPGVQFYTGQLLDIRAITQAAHSVGAVMGVDLAHAVGNVPLQLHAWGVDFAAWCHYKYCNSGPGAIAGLFVHRRHAYGAADVTPEMVTRTIEPVDTLTTENTLTIENEHDLRTKSIIRDRPRFAGWWGQPLKDRFAMDSIWRGEGGARGYQLSNPPVTSVLGVEAGLQELCDAGIQRLRAKSEKLTAYLEALVAAKIPEAVQLTPRDATQRYDDGDGAALCFLYVVTVHAFSPST